MHNICYDNINQTVFISTWFEFSCASIGWTMGFNQQTYTKDLHIAKQTNIRANTTGQAEQKAQSCRCHCKSHRAIT